MQSMEDFSERGGGRQGVRRRSVFCLAMIAIVNRPRRRHRPVPRPLVISAQMTQLNCHHHNTASLGHFHALTCTA